MNPVEIAALDALDLLVVVDNESDTLSSVDKRVPQLPELGRLVARVPHLAPKDGHDCVEPWGHLCLACHGFSALVTGRRGSEERSVLFDVGPSAEVWLENARRLGVRLASIEAVCLSHWHTDHSGGLLDARCPEVTRADGKFQISSNFSECFGFTKGCSAGLPRAPQTHLVFHFWRSFHHASRDRAAIRRNLPAGSLSDVFRILPDAGFLSEIPRMDSVEVCGQPHL